MVDIAQVTQQAQAMSAQNGQSPEQNAYSILRNVYGMTNAQMDSLWGFAPGSVDAVFGRQDGAGVGIAGNGMLAQQSGPVPLKQPADMWGAIKAGQMTPDQADAANNWPAGTTIKWAESSGLAQPIVATFEETGGRGGATRTRNETVGYNYANADGTVTDVNLTGGTSGTYQMGNTAAPSNFGVKMPGGGGSDGIFSFGQDISRVLQSPSLAKGLLTAGTMVLAGNAIAGQPTFGPEMAGPGAANPMQLDPATIQGQTPLGTGTPIGVPTVIPNPVTPTAPVTPTPTTPTPTTPVTPVPSPDGTVVGGSPVTPAPGGTPVVIPPISQIPGVNGLPTWLQQMLPGLLTSAGGIVAGNSAVDAAKVQADAQIKAAQIAADAAKFKPVGVTTGFGSSQFGFDDKGNLTSAGYQLTPEMQALRNQLTGSLGGLLTQAQGARDATAPLGAAAQQAMSSGQNMMGVGNNVLNQAQQLFYDPKAIQNATLPIAQTGQQAVTQGQNLLGYGADIVAQAKALNIDPAVLQAMTAPIGAAGQQALGLGQNAMGLSQGLMTDAQGLRVNPAAVQASTAPMSAAAQRAMQLGQGYLSTDPQAQAAKYYADQMKLLEPTRAAEMAALQAQMQAQGRGGFAIGGGVGGQGAANPQLQALFNAQMQQNNQLAADATRGGMEYVKFGTDLNNAGGSLLQNMYGTQAAAYNPYNAATGAATNMGTYGANMAGQGNNLIQGMFNTQAAAYNPFKTVLGIGTDTMNSGANLAGQGSNLMQSMFNVQNAAYQPYNTLMGTAQNALTGGANLSGQGANLLTGMYNAQNAAYQPFNTALGSAQTIEGLGQDALTQGMNLGSAVTAANANAGGLLSRGMNTAANTMAPANAYSPWGTALSGFGNILAGVKL